MNIQHYSIFFCFLLSTLPLTVNAQANPFLAPATPALATGSLPGTIAAMQVSRQSKVYPLSYAQAEELQKALQPLFTGKLSVDIATNSLLFNSIDSEQQTLKQLLPKLDVATNQVTLEAKIIAVNQENSKELGVNWSWDNIPQRERQTADSDSDSDNDEEQFGGNFKFWHGYSFRFNAKLNALIANGKAKILATPRIITIPGKQASIFIGDHIPVQTEKHTNGDNYTSTEYLDAGIKLQYLPRISQDGKMVTASVHTEVSTQTLISELKNYRITSRTADTNVRMYSGETLAIGGLLGEEEQRNLQRVPFLSDIPILGELFKNRSKRHSKTEVIILLTPHITQAGQSPSIYGKLE